MEIKAKTLVIWLVLLIIGAALIVGPVVAYNETGIVKPRLPQIKAMDSGTQIKIASTTKDTDKNVKDLDKDKKDKKDKHDDTIKIKSHPVLKSPSGNGIYVTGQRWGPENK